MLIVGTIIWDRDLGFSLAALIGLGTGWTAILLLDVVGKRVMDIIRMALGLATVSSEAREKYDRDQVSRQLRDAFPVSRDGERDLSRLLDHLPDEG